MPTDMTNYCEVVKQDVDDCTGTTSEWYECGSLATLKHQGRWMCDRCYDVFNEPDNPPTASYEEAKGKAMQKDKNAD
jgi:hypothetical protein